jgi:hypothetical protein
MGCASVAARAERHGGSVAVGRDISNSQITFGVDEEGVGKVLEKLLARIAEEKGLGCGPARRIDLRAFRPPALRRARHQTDPASSRLRNPSCQWTRDCAIDNRSVRAPNDFTAWMAAEIGRQQDGQIIFQKALPKLAQ